MMPLIAHLTGDDICACEDMTVRSSMPIIAMCRMLIQAGYHPALPMEVWREELLALRVTKIGLAARLRPRTDCPGGGFAIDNEYVRAGSPPVR
jgi:hypothetical protein